MLNNLRDRLDEREWDRVWRDPPGFFLPNCLCCGCIDCTNSSRDCGPTPVVVPLTLFATFGNSGVCAAFDSQVFTLTWSVIDWQKSFTDVNGCAWVITLGCNNGGGGNKKYVLSIRLNGGAGGECYSSPVCAISCSPFHLSIPDAQRCNTIVCPSCSFTTWSVDVTE